MRQLRRWYLAAVGLHFRPRPKQAPLGLTAGAMAAVAADGLTGTAAVVAADGLTGTAAVVVVGGSTAGAMAAAVHGSIGGERLYRK